MFIFNLILDQFRTERKEHERRPRLIAEEELPDWLVKEDEEVDRWNYDQEDDSILGRGSRQRKEVDYTDSLTEKEWLKAIDGENDFDDSNGKHFTKFPSPNRRHW